MVVLLVTRLRDVEHQLWQAATAVKLHLKLLNASPRYHNDVAVAADQVQALVTSIEQVQNELQVSTTEMLSLAKKFDTKEDNHNDDIADSEETETEDDEEGVELEDYSQQKEEEKELPEAVKHVEQSAEEEKEKLTVDGTVEFLKTLPVGQETVDLTQDVDEDQETVEEEQEVTTMEEKKLVTQSSKRLNDEEIEVSQKNDDEENASIETEPVVDESKEEEEEREVSVEKEKKVFEWD
ncbi:hypothetical protein BBJ29_004807 [Phytophthora kernoviae]|uniref:Uncharacterized protein n=1 Tax=Phytophthora kernoviae TaxID=325452 RepID=A0A3F2S4H8_9STRA|nr:hypothetical protein BBJ29_004807 [Phytophthora kernoviae]RLN69567.1 hypothetical protein BBP00_00000211 [Phytophthora kernoviae]